MATTEETDLKKDAGKFFWVSQETTYEYALNDDGSYKLDGDGNKIVSKTFNGGLTADSQIGVYSKNNSKATNTFGRTVYGSSSSSTNSVNFAKISNDKDPGLYGAAGRDNRLIWSMMVPVNVVVKQTEAMDVDNWYTFQITGATTGSRGRFTVKVAANATSGSKVVMVPVGVNGLVKCIESTSPYGHTVAYTSYVNESADSTNPTNPTVVTDDTIIDRYNTSASSLCGIQVNTNNFKMGDIVDTTEHGIRELTFTSTVNLADTTRRLTTMEEVTNTMNTP